MMGLLLGMGLFALFFLVHLTWWRVSRPRATARALFLGLAAMLVLSVPAGPTLASVASLSYDLSFHLQGVLLAAAFSAAYIATYPALEVTSPTLAILDSIAATGDAGLERRVLFSHMDDAFLLHPRIADLASEGLVSTTRDRYLLTPKGRRVAMFFIRLRALLRLPAGG